MTCFSTSCCYSQSSLVDDSSHTCNSRRLYRCALAISNICFAILALVCAAFIVSGASELIVILGLVISLVLCGVLLVINLCCFRNSHVVVANIVDSEMDGVGGSNQRSVTGLISETNLTVDSHVVGDVLEEELPLVVDKVDEESLVSVSEVVSDFHTAEEESVDGESTSILDTAFQLSSSSVDETLIREETDTADYNLGLLFDNSLTVDTETTLDAEGYVGEETLIPASFHSAIGRNYPEMIHQLCIQENLTIQELRLLIEGVNQGNPIESYPNSLKIKLQNFSFSRLQSESLGTGLRPLDDVLLKECPFTLSIDWLPWEIGHFLNPMDYLLKFIGQAVGDLLILMIQSSRLSFGFYRAQYLEKNTSRCLNMLKMKRGRKRRMSLLNCNVV